MRISHEAIYQSLYVQGRGALRRELTACLRTGRALRVPRARTRGRGKGFVRPEIMISQRPAEAEDRAVPGHWEGDLILGLDSSAIGTLVASDRQAYTYLPQSVARFVTPDELSALMTEVGLRDVRYRRVGLGTIATLEHATVQAVAEPVAEARADVEQQPAAYLDETGWREGQQRA